MAPAASVPPPTADPLQHPDLHTASGRKPCPVAIHLSDSTRLEAAVFAQTIRGKTFDPWAVRPLVDRWMKELAPGAIGWLGTTSGVTDDNELFVLVRFESENDARGQQR